MTKVSICIPAYKDFHGIRRLLNSIRTQNFSDYEIVLTDDTPDDSVRKILDEYNDLEIRYFHNDSPLGACGNWNRSLDEACGEYIKIMHQDDFFTFDNSLSEFVAMLDDNPDAVMGFCGSRQTTIKENDPYDISDFFDRCISDENLSNFEKDYRDLYNGDWVGAPSATIYRNCDKRFDAELTWIIDVDFYMSLLSGGQKFICSKAPLVSIGVSENQLTNRCIDDGELNIKEYRHVMQKYNLNTVFEYRKRICYIAVMYKMGYASISDLDIPKKEYTRVLSDRRRYLASFYINLIKRKITGHE